MKACQAAGRGGLPRAQSLVCTGCHSRTKAESLRVVFGCCLFGNFGSSCVVTGNSRRRKGKSNRKVCTQTWRHGSTKQEGHMDARQIEPSESSSLGLREVTGVRVLGWVDNFAMAISCLLEIVFQIKRSETIGLKENSKTRDIVQNSKSQENQVVASGAAGSRSRQAGGQSL